MAHSNGISSIKKTNRLVSSALVNHVITVFLIREFVSYKHNTNVLLVHRDTTKNTDIQLIEIYFSICFLAVIKLIAILLRFYIWVRIYLSSKLIIVKDQITFII